MLISGLTLVMADRAALTPGDTLRDTLRAGALLGAAEQVGVSVQVAELEAAWNDRFEADFGLRVPDARRGVLQDVHWSAGLFGYFPTYALGNIYAAESLFMAGINPLREAGKVSRERYQRLATAVKDSGNSAISCSPISSRRPSCSRSPRAWISPASATPSPAPLPCRLT